MKNKQKLQVKGMVCQRCIFAVKTQLESIGIYAAEITLGEVSLTSSTVPDIIKIEEKLKPLGFSILEDKKSVLVKKVKQLVEEVYSGEFDFPNRFRFSERVSEILHKDYDKISAAFSSLEHITLEKYILDFRTEKIKEFLVYTPRTLEDMAFRLGFSSVAHLSSQFKAVTGFSPSHFKSISREKALLQNKAGQP